VTLIDFQATFIFAIIFDSLIPMPFQEKNCIFCKKKEKVLKKKIESHE